MMVENAIRGTSWTEAEDAILKQYFPSEGREAYRHLPKRTATACVVRAHILGVRLSVERRAAAVARGSAQRQDLWTEEENAILREHYPIEGRKAFDRLPNRTATACDVHVSVLGLRHNGRNWSEREEGILRQYYRAEGPDVCKRLPGRTQMACALRARRLGVQMDSSKRYIRSTSWTPEEEAILRRYYPSEGPNMYHRLPGRTRAACAGRAATIGVAYRCTVRGGHPVWTAEEDAILRAYYPAEGPAVFKRLPGRTYNACAQRAGKLGCILRTGGRRETCE